MKEIAAVRSSNIPMRPLPILVPLIKRELHDGYEAGVEHYRRAGEMLIEAKEQLDHGEWQNWVPRNFTTADGTPLSARQARRYMELAERQNGRARPFSSIRAATNESGDGKVSWQAPVQRTLQRINFDALREERQAKEKEDRLIRQLAAQLIDIGYKVLATKLHPDKTGGSTEAMSRLNKVRALLRAAL